MNTHDIAILTLGIVIGWGTIIATVRISWAIAKRHVARHTAN